MLFWNIWWGCWFNVSLRWFLFLFGYVSIIVNYLIVSCFTLIFLYQLTLIFLYQLTFITHKLFIYWFWLLFYLFGRLIALVLGIVSKSCFFILSLDKFWNIFHRGDSLFRLYISRFILVTNKEVCDISWPWLFILFNILFNSIFILIRLVVVEFIRIVLVLKSKVKLYLNCLIRKTKYSSLIYRWLI